MGDAAVPAPAARNDPVLTVEGVSLRFGGLAALTDVSFSVHDGEVVGIVGANGAGKTSLINCISGTYRPSSGSIRMGRVGVSAIHRWDRARVGISRTFQHPSMIPGLSVMDNVLLGAHCRMKTMPIGTVFRSRRFRLLRANWERIVIAQLDKLGLAGQANRVIDELPYGDRKLVDLARAMIADPSLLLLDEPTSGLTNKERGAVRHALEDLRATHTTSIVIIEHDMPFLTAIAPRLVVLELGKVIADGPTAATMGDTRVRTSFLGAIKGGQGGSGSANSGTHAEGRALWM